MKRLLLLFLTSLLLTGDGLHTPPPSMEYLLRMALLPVGKTMYIWGGGWSTTDASAGIDAKHFGLSSRWEEFANLQTSKYDYTQTRFQNRDGLDCSGYIGWLLYNTLSVPPATKGYVFSSTRVAKHLSSMGWGQLLHSDDFLCGDICSMKGHVYLCLGSCPDGSVLLIHSSPPGVRISGTYLSAPKKSQAVLLATYYMQKYYPEWYTRFPQCGVSSKYLSCEKLRWYPKTLADASLWQSFQGAEVLHRLFVSQD